MSRPLFFYIGISIELLCASLCEERSEIGSDSTIHHSYAINTGWGGLMAAFVIDL